MTTILLARHGETDWNRERRWQGHADTPLNGTGRAQAAELARRLAPKPLVAVYSSDLSRARETAEIVAAPHGLAVRLDPGFRETAVGAWEGLTQEEVEERFPDGKRPGAEDPAAFGRRVVAALERTASRHGRGETILVVTHGGSIRQLQRHVLGEPATVLPNCGLFALSAEGGQMRRID